MIYDVLLYKNGERNHDADEKDLRLRFSQLLAPDTRRRWGTSHHQTRKNEHTGLLIGTHPQKQFDLHKLKKRSAQKHITTVFLSIRKHEYQKGMTFDDEETIIGLWDCDSDGMPNDLCTG